MNEDEEPQLDEDGNVIATAEGDENTSEENGTNLENDETQTEENE